MAEPGAPGVRSCRFGRLTPGSFPRPRCPPRDRGAGSRGSSGSGLPSSRSPGRAAQPRAAGTGWPSRPGKRPPPYPGLSSLLERQVQGLAPSWPSVTDIAAPTSPVRYFPLLQSKLCFNFVEPDTFPPPPCNASGKEGRRGQVSSGATRCRLVSSFPPHLAGLHHGGEMFLMFYCCPSVNPYLPLGCRWLRGNLVWWLEGKAIVLGKYNYPFRR